eukprot:gene10749-11947_t
MSMLGHIILSNFLSTFDASVQQMAKGLVQASIAVYNTIVNELRPAPVNSEDKKWLHKCLGRSAYVEYSSAVS